jgi:protein SCO1/2
LIDFRTMQKFSVLKVALALCLGIACSACGRATKSAENTQHYETRGIVRGISPDRTTVQIQHKNIPDFMPSMTMPFSVRDQKEIVNLKTGDAISFRLTVTEKDFWIDQVKKIDREQVSLGEPAPTPPALDKGSPRLREGDPMPAFSLTDQNGRRITLDTFHDRPLVLTFVFTRCAVPNFCPRMSSNFSELQSAIKTAGGALAQTRLLSITLDPAFDTPEILNQYGAHQHADPNVWSLATGDAAAIDALTHAFSVYVQTEGGTLSHGLATTLIDRDGKIVKIWRGNGWTPAEVLREIH